MVYTTELLCFFSKNNLNQVKSNESEVIWEKYDSHTMNKLQIILMAADYTMDKNISEYSLKIVIFNNDTKTDNQPNYQLKLTECAGIEVINQRICYMKPYLQHLLNSLF